MPQLSAKEAADRAGMTKAGIIKAIKTGKLSAGKNDRGEWKIDPSELLRAYPPGNTPFTATVAPQVDAGAHHQIAGLQAEIALLRELVRRADERADRAEAAGERWAAALERSQALLTDARVQEARRPLWARLLGR